MSFSKKILAMIVCMCLFMGATTFMVYASAQPFPVFTIQTAGGEDPATSSKTSTSKPVSTSKPSSDPTSAPDPTSTPDPTSPSPTSTASVEKSSDCYLSNLSVVRGTLTPGFNREVTEYSVVILGGEGVPGVKPTASHNKASVKKNVPVLAMGGHASATVVVTAEDGSQRTYTLNMTREPGDSSMESSSSEDMNLSSGLDISGDYPSENSLDMSGLFGSDGEMVGEISDDETPEKKGSNWLLYVGIVLILGALGGIGFVVYRQFFARPRGGYGDGYYDDGYGDYDGDDGYDGPYDDGYADDGYADDGYADDGYADGNYQDTADGGYGAQSDLYDEPTTYIPQSPQDANYGEYRSQQGQNPGYTRRNGGQAGGRAQPPGQGQYRRGGQGPQPPRGNNGRRG